MNPRKARKLNRELDKRGRGVIMIGSLRSEAAAISSIRAAVFA